MEEKFFVGQNFLFNFASKAFFCCLSIFIISLSFPTVCRTKLYRFVQEHNMYNPIHENCIRVWNMNFKTLKENYNTWGTEKNIKKWNFTSSYSFVNSSGEIKVVKRKTTAFSRYFSSSIYSLF